MITSNSNAQVKRLLQLQKKSKARNEEQVFLVEGLRMFLEVPTERVQKVYISETLYNKKKQDLDLEKFSVEILSDSVFSYVSDTKLAGMNTLASSTTTLRPPPRICATGAFNTS